MDEIQAQANGDLQRPLEAALGSAHRVAGITRLRGGTKKGVYRAVVDDSSVIIYVWGRSENYWPTPDSEAANDASDPFGDASGADGTPRRHLASWADNWRCTR